MLTLGFIEQLVCVILILSGLSISGSVCHINVSCFIEQLAYLHHSNSFMFYRKNGIISHIIRGFIEQALDIRLTLNKH